MPGERVDRLAHEFAHPLRARYFALERLEVAAAMVSPW